LIELVVALSVTLVVGAATMTLAISARKLYEQDRNRTTLNQNVRCGMDLLGIDARQAGERMPGDAPAIEVQNGSSGAPDTLILRRNLMDYVMPVCKDINPSSAADAIFVAKKGGGSVPAGCAPVADSDGDGWPDNIQAWRNYRISQGGSVLAYLYNPVTGLGEFFTYDAEDNSTFKLHRLNTDSWTNSYTTSQNPRIYLIEQRRYTLSGDVLQCIINEDTAHPLNLVNRIKDFQVSALMQDGTTLSTVPATTDWTKLYALEIRLVGRSTFLRRTMERTLVGRFFPRNILSD
jgi:type IV pilus assembly protein PilW